jgi:diguanylate cyclase (GGDEF)-like protein
MKRGPQSTLREVVHRAHLGMALVAVALAGVMLLLAGLIALRVYMDNNLQLVARSLAYTVEAAVIFGDRDNANETMQRMLVDEGVAEARVRDARGAVFAEWSGAQQGLGNHMGQALVAMVGLEPATAPIQYEGTRAGEVMLRSDGLGLLHFVTSGLVALLVCVAVSGVVGMVLSRRMLQDMVTPLQSLARVARTVRRDRTYGLRVPAARIAELRALGDDFNALLDELEQREQQLEQKNMALTHQAMHDSLTGLPNRAHFEQYLQAKLEQARQACTSMALMFLDNDHFKKVNDTYGHAAGDALLMAVGQRVRAQLRAQDLVARLGGDEFAIVMAVADDVEDASKLADRVIAAMREPVVLGDGTRLQPSVSIGVALFPDHGHDMTTLLRAADAAMYHVKAHRRGCRHVAQAERNFPAMDNGPLPDSPAPYST